MSRDKQSPLPLFSSKTSEALELDNRAYCYSFGWRKQQGEAAYIVEKELVGMDN